jgi:hypothetical protein
VYVRVVRFNDVMRDRLEGLLARVDERGGPPPGVSATRVQILFDEQQGTAVVLQHFESADDMRSSEEALSGMDPSETPGTRVSVDRCELVRELSSSQ